MHVDPNSLTTRERYKILTSSVLPRPIAWISSRDKNGVLNIAPFSYFTVVCNNPMTMLFCPGVSATNAGKKDTLRNIEEVPEFVINLVSEPLANKMNLTATNLPPEESEFEWARLTPEPSKTISVPRVGEAPISFECILQRIIPVNTEPGGGYAVFGEVQHIHIQDEIFDRERGIVEIEGYQPIGRLGGPNYTRVTDTFSMERINLPAEDDK